MASGLMDLLRNVIERLALSNDVLARIIGGFVKALELLGDLLHLSFGMRLADQLAKVKIFQRVAC